MAEGAIIFDLDGVLADSQGPIIACVNLALEAIGRPQRPEADVQAIIGPPSHIGFAQLIGEEPTAPLVDEMVMAYRARYTDALWATRAFPGAAEAARALAAQRPVAIATSKPRQHAEPVLQAIGLDDLFDVVAAPVPGGPGDKLAMVTQAMEGIGDAAVMVGDRRYDIEAGLARGLHTVGVLWGYGSRAELTDAGAHTLLEDPAQLVAACLAA